LIGKKEQLIDCENSSIQKKKKKQANVNTINLHKVSLTVAAKRVVNSHGIDTWVPT